MCGKVKSCVKLQTGGLCIETVCAGFIRNCLHRMWFENGLHRENTGILRFFRTQDMLETDCIEVGIRDTSLHASCPLSKLGEVDSRFPVYRKRCPA